MNFSVKTIVVASVGFVLLLLVLSSFYTVNQGFTGVVLRNGALVGVAQPGLGMKVPLIDRVVKFSVKTNSKIYEDVEAYSRDQQLASLTISITYRLLPELVGTIYSDFGNEEALLNRLVDRRVLELTKTVFGQFNAPEAIQLRASLNQRISESITQSLSGTQGLIIESIQIEDIAFSAAYENSVEARMMAEVEVQKRAQELEQQRIQAQIVVTQAQGAADARVAEAKAQAEATILAGDAEAQAIRAKGEALRDNPQLVALITAENWDGKLPTTMVPGSTVPFLDVER